MSRVNRRRSIRLKEHDYSQAGAYFVTICVQDRVCLFGEITNQEMRLNDAGQVVHQCWDDIPAHFPHVTLDVFVVMPNHIHGVLIIDDLSVGEKIGVPVGAKNFSPLHPGQPPRGTSRTIGAIIRGFKIGVTKWMRRNTSVQHIWQRNYYEHIIRNETELKRIREYIADNPARWESDRENPNAVGLAARIKKNFEELGV